MGYSLGKFDSSASFYAINTSKLGKNEIHIYPLQHESSKITAPNSLSSSFELDSQDELVTFDWIQQKDLANGKKTKRRHSLNGSARESSSSLSYLAVSFKSGSILIYSPFKKEIINEFKTDHKISALASSANSFWVASSTEVYEYELNDSKPKNQITLPMSLKEITFLKHVIIDDDEYLLAGGNKLVVYNITKDELIIEYPAPKGKKSITINSIAYIDDHVLISRNGESSIHIYSLKNKSTRRTLAASAEIKSLITIDGTDIGVLTKDGAIEVFRKVLDESTTSPAFSIKSSNTDIGFAAASFSREQLVLSWFDFEPNFEAVKLFKVSTDLEINTKQTLKTNKQDNRVAEQIIADIEFDETLEVRDIDLATLIETTLKQPSELLTILISNPDVNKIRFASSELSFENAVELFKILKERVEINASESPVFNNWIKWLLMTHTSAINSSANLKSLKGAYSRSLKQLPNLLSLQGRLEMLQSQLQLRNQIVSNEIVESSTKDPIEQAEESIVYVNGENDEAEDDVIGSVGNSESGEHTSDEEEEETAVNGGALEEANE